MRWRLYIVYVGDGYKVKHYKEKVLITLVSVLNIILLAIIYMVTYVYSKQLKVKYFIGWLRLSRYI
jgi:hypothetical protein